MSEGFEKKQTVYTQHQALVKAESWCAYQERCQQEVRDKMYSWRLHEHEVENIISELISKNFLNEERFAKAYVGGKFRMKKWGRVKIRMELKRRKLSDYCIKKGMAEINEDDYRDTIRKLAEEKMRSIKERDSMKKRYKVMSFLASKGYESELVREIVGDVD